MNNNSITFFTLITALKTGGTITIDGIEGFVQSIEREDGSGKCFNVTIRPLSQYVNIRVFVRTID